MNKAELIAAIAKKNSITRKDAEKLVMSVFETVTETLSQGEKVSIVGFGTFEVKVRAPHEGINPMTKEKIQIAENHSPVFKAGKQLKEAVSKGKAPIESDKPEA